MQSFLNNQNVISLHSARSGKGHDPDLASDKIEEAESSQENADAQTVGFHDIMEKNRKLKEKMRKDRMKSNESVLRSYRIKK